MTFSEKTLHNKVALITGAGQPLANALARRFALVGARLALVYLLPEAKAAAQFAETSTAELVMECDPTDPRSVNSTVQQVLAEFGRIDLLVNSILHRVEVPLGELAFPQWCHALDVQLSGTLYFCREVIRPMMRKRAGRIINVIDNFGGGASATAGRGIEALTRALASELIPHNIVVTALSVNSPGLQSAPPKEAERTTVDKTRSSSWGEIAEAAVFLASDSANSTVGQPLPLNGCFF